MREQEEEAQKSPCHSGIKVLYCYMVNKITRVEWASGPLFFIDLTEFGKESE